MKICMVLYDMNEFGGLEEYASSLAVGIQKKGHRVSVFSSAWVRPDNQYLSRFIEHKIPFIQIPKWISHPVSDWNTKEKVLSAVLVMLTPLIFLLSMGVMLLKRKAWVQSYESARNWLRGKLLVNVIGPDWRKPFSRIYLNLWNFYWHPDVYHLQGYTTNLLFIIDWAARKNIPVVYEEHQTPDPQFNWWKDFSRIINKANIVVAVSEKSADALREVCGVTQPIVVRSPLLVDPLEKMSLQEFRSERLGLPLQITTVARLYVTKGLTYLLDAAAKIKAIHPEIEFKVYGDGPLRQDLLTYACSLGLDGKSIFQGSFTTREDLTRIMQNTDLYVMSSILEGQPLALVEAMAYGCPIVTTAVGGIPELIEDGVNGLLCEPSNSACLAEKIITLIENPALRQSLGEAARKTYELSSFQPSNVSDELISIYKMAI